MAARGHQVRILQPLPRVPLFLRSGPRADWRSYPKRQRSEGLDIIRPRYLHLPGRALGNARRFARVAVSSLASPDVVVADYAWPAARIASHLADLEIPCVVHGRGSDVLHVRENPALARELSLSLQSAGHWCAVSEDLVLALDELGQSPGHGVLTPNGVDTARFTPGDREGARRRLDHSGDTRPWVLVVGHLIERKDPLLALEAFRVGAPRDARLIYLGRGPLEAQLRAAAKAPDLEGRVDLIGEVSPEELADWYRAGDALLLTSSREGRPNVVLEAFACGLPVVATSAGGTAELFGSWEGGLALTRAASDIGGRLARVLDTPPPTAELVSGVRNLTWERSFEALEGVLQAALNDAGGGSV